MRTVVISVPPVLILLLLAAVVTTVGVSGRAAGALLGAAFLTVARNSGRGLITGVHERLAGNGLVGVGGFGFSLFYINLALVDFSDGDLIYQFLGNRFIFKGDKSKAS